MLPVQKIDTLLAECGALSALELPARIMVKCGAPDGAPYVQAAHSRAVAGVASAIAAGSRDIFGVLIPSFLLGGRQDLQPVSHGTIPEASSRKAHIYGMSVTEACMDWSSTTEALEDLAAAVRTRRGNGEKRARLA